jgi:hypothetical protein
MMSVKGRRMLVACMLVSIAMLVSSCGDSAKTVGARTVRPSVAQIQALVDEKLNPAPKASPTAALPRGATDLERALAKSKEFNRHPERHIDSQTTGVDESTGRFKCLTTYSGGVEEKQVTSVTCSQATSLSCITETTRQ